MALDVETFTSPNRKPRRPVAVRDARLTPLGYTQYAFPSAGVSISINQLTFAGRPGIPENARIVLINVEGAAIRYRDDGGDVDSTTGELWPVGSSFSRTLRDLTQIRVCGATPGAIINVSSYAVI